jgi:hypothetical protein
VQKLLSLTFWVSFSASFSSVSKPATQLSLNTYGIVHTPTAFVILPLLHTLKTKYKHEKTSKTWKNGRLKVHKIENFFDFDFGICDISLLVMHK